LDNHNQQIGIEQKCEEPWFQHWCFCWILHPNYRFFFPIFQSEVLKGLRYDGVSSFCGNKNSQVNYTKTNWFHAMKLLRLLKVTWNVYFQNLEQKDRVFHWEKKFAPGDEVGLPGFRATATKTVRVNNLFWNFVIENKTYKDISKLGTL
jgi:hypothetical protein